VNPDQFENIIGSDLQLNFEKNESPEEKAAKIFNEFDKNKNGQVDQGELKSMFKRLGYDHKGDDSHVNEMIKQFDSNKDGLLNLDEFTYLFRQLKSRASAANVSKNEEVRQQTVVVQQQPVLQKAPEAVPEPKKQSVVVAEAPKSAQLSPEDEELAL
jgi:hypothetical protein